MHSYWQPALSAAGKTMSVAGGQVVCRGGPVWTRRALCGGVCWHNVQYPLKESWQQPPRHTTLTGASCVCFSAWFGDYYRTSLRFTIKPECLLYTGTWVCSASPCDLAPLHRSVIHHTPAVSLEPQLCTQGLTSPDKGYSPPQPCSAATCLLLREGGPGAVEPGTELGVGEGVGDKGPWV